MVNSSKPVIRITDLEQVCIVVSDIDKTVESLQNTFGIGPWNIGVYDSNSMKEVTYYGKPARFTWKGASTTSKLGGFEIELIQPIEGDSIYRDFLKQHGEGVHHVGWVRVDSVEAFDETAKKLESAGFPCIMCLRDPSRAFGYFDTTKVLNTVLEVST